MYIVVKVTLVWTEEYVCGHLRNPTKIVLIFGKIRDKLFAYGIIIKMVRLQKKGSNTFSSFYFQMKISTNADQTHVRTTPPAMTG